MAAVPPLFAALYFRVLGKITTYTGVAGLVITFIFPAMLPINSERVLSQKGLPSETFYYKFESSKSVGLLSLSVYFQPFFVWVCYSLVGTKLNRSFFVNIQRCRTEGVDTTIYLSA